MVQDLRARDHPEDPQRALSGPGICIAVDLETTGLSPPRDRIVEVGALAFDAEGQTLGTFQALVDPGRPIPPATSRVHGIADADVADAPTEAEVLPRFLGWLATFPDATLLAHNASFDAAFLGAAFDRIGLAPVGLNLVDTLPASRRRWPTGSHRLDALADRLGIPAPPAHRALADCLRVAGLWRAIVEGVDGWPPGAIAYPVQPPQPSGMPAPPVGLEALSQAIRAAARVRFRYEGGTHGHLPREASPLRIEARGGVAYLVAHCHLDDREKSFRLDRFALLGLVE